MKLANLKNALIGDERAVSPVIGVILMVAITVILAAVIGTFVLGLGGNVQTQVQAGANINFNEAVDNGQATATYNSNQNAEYLQVQFLDGTGSPINVSGTAWTVSGGTAVDASLGQYRLSSVGESVSLNEDATLPADDNTVLVRITAFGEDGQSTVIVEKEDTI